jgi:hypothetical protein
MNNRLPGVLESGLYFFIGFRYRILEADKQLVFTSIPGRILTISTGEFQMDGRRKTWNDQQQTLRQLLNSGDHDAAIQAFFRQHAMVHSAVMAETGLWSFADEVLQDITDAAMRCIPRNGEHSVAWIIWHMARIEDVTMNLLVAGSPQLLHQDGWFDRMNVPYRHTGNAMAPEQIADLSATIDLDALKAYRVAVGRRTREVVGELPPESLKLKVDPARLQQITDEGAMLAGAGEILAYWNKRTIAGLLLMPPTRHNFVHLNEAQRVKRKCS